ncbi:MAG: YqaA family protein [Pirellulaceae bacterium]
MMTETETSLETGSAAEAAPSPVPRWAIHRRMYDWVLSFAHHKHSSTALFLFSFMESSFFPIPPDVLLGPLCLGHRQRSLWFATICTMGSVLGAFLGYAIGFGALWLAYMIPGVTEEKVAWLSNEFAARGQWYVLIAALTPIPFKLLTITAGAASMNMAVFTLACVVGRSARFFGVAVLFWLVGPKALPLIDKYFNLLCIVFVVLLVGGFAMLKFIGH